MAKYKKEVHKSCFDICLFYFLYFSDNTKLSSSFQPSYDDVGKAWEKDNGCNDTASEEAIEEDWIIVDGPKIGNAELFLQKCQGMTFRFKCFVKKKL